MCERALSWPSHEQLMSVLVHFPAKLLRESEIIHPSDNSSTRDSICHVVSLVIMQRSLFPLDLRLSSSKCCWPRGTCGSLLVGLWFQLRLGLIHVSSIATIWRKNAWSSTSNLSFGKVTVSRCFCFYAHTTSMKTINPTRKFTTRRSTVNSLQISFKAPWISMGFLPRKFFIFMWPLIWNSHSTWHICRLHF